MTDTFHFIPTWPPNWVNASNAGMRAYSSSDSILIQDYGVTKCIVSSVGSRFVSIFGSAFTVIFLFVCWLGIDDLRQRVLFMALGVFCGVLTFGLFYALMKHHQERGDYVVVDGKNNRVELPRHKRVFRAADVCCLQLLTGREKNEEVINRSDLNILVDEDGEIVRYHLMGNPNKEHAQVIADAIKTSLIEQSVPAGWYRSSDAQNGP